MADRPPPRFPPGKNAVYRPNNSKTDGIGGLLLSDQMRDATTAAANDVARIAHDLTPLGDGSDGGHMRDRYKVKREGGTLKVSGNIRVMVLVENDSPHSAAVEFGNKMTKRHRPLGRAGGQVGEFKESKRKGAK